LARSRIVCVDPPPADWPMAHPATLIPTSAAIARFFFVIGPPPSGRLTGLTGRGAPEGCRRWQRPAMRVMGSVGWRGGLRARRVGQRFLSHGSIVQPCPVSLLRNRISYAYSPPGVVFPQRQLRNGLQAAFASKPDLAPSFLSDP
jgi:hypothetical protein